VKPGACDSCLRRAWLQARLSGHLDVERKRIWESLGLSDEELLKAVAGRSEQLVRTEFAAFGPSAAARAREHAKGRGLDLVCGCDQGYPSRLRALLGPPAVLHVAGGIERLARFAAQDPTALVGARRASAYGTGVAHSLGRGLGVAGVTVVSGLAAGIDAAAHRGALEGAASTIAVLPGPADRAYPRGNASLYREIVRRGVVLSEIAPDTPVRSWMFTARNRVIAALARATVVVQAAPRSGSLLTARAASELERPIGAVPGPVTSQLSAGPNRLLADGAVIIRGTQDVLDLLYGAGGRTAAADLRPRPSASQAALLEAIADGIDTTAALVGTDAGGRRCLAELSALELAGRVRRGPGGRLSVIP
jgi:DNA processing protein